MISKAIRKAKIGNPNLATASTAWIERQNLTLRTMQRRFVRLGLAFSKSWDHLWAACALHVAYFNFVWTPKPLNGFTPAAELNVTDKLWSVEDLVGEC